MQYRTIADLSELIRNNIQDIPHNIDLVVGIPRSGMLPASIIALFLNIRFTDLDSFLRGEIYGVGQTRGHTVPDREVKKILVVDDSVQSGGSMRTVKQRLSGIADSYDLIYYTVYITTQAKNVVDFYGEIIDEYRIFEWNLYHHNFFLQKASFDMDGVLCQDPTIDDDGEKYLEFLKSAKPKFIPTVPINTIVSCRLEKYRKETENWLERNGVKYSSLIMLDLPDKDSRIKWGKHGEYKAEQFKKNGDWLFIESSYAQALTIAQISKKPVICVETNSLLYNPPVKEKVKNKYPFIYKVLKKGKSITNKFFHKS